MVIVTPTTVLANLKMSKKDYQVFAIGHAKNALYPSGKFCNGYTNNGFISDDAPYYTITSDGSSTITTDLDSTITTDLDSNCNYRPPSVVGALTRKTSIASRMEEIDENPFRRRLSFIKNPSDEADEESLVGSSIQIFVASLCAGFGNVGAGVVLDKIQTWRAFRDISEMFILVPSLLGLKGNLEMTMAARLSTEANLGHMNKWAKTAKMIGGDMMLVQCQATVVSFLAAAVAIGTSSLRKGTFVWRNSIDLCASSMLAANIACFLLGMVMAVVIIFSHKMSVNPDNIATPIAASLGDVSTALIFAYSAEMIHNSTLRQESDGLPLTAFFSICIFLALLPLFYAVARQNTFTRQLVHTGWTPIITAMVISSGGGLFLDRAVARYDRLPPFQPVICGVGGNLVAISASRISTWLFKNANFGALPSGVDRFYSPIKAFSRQNINSKLASLLLLMALPLHSLYVVVIWLIQRERIVLTSSLVLMYISFSIFQVAVLLYFGFNLVHYLWSKKINPDNSSIPILTASGDLFGSMLLLIGFHILEIIGDPNANVIKNAAQIPTLANMTMALVNDTVEFNTTTEIDTLTFIWAADNSTLTVMV